MDTDSHFDPFVTLRIENSHSFYHSETHVNTTYCMIILQGESFRRETINLQCLAQDVVFRLRNEKLTRELGHPDTQ